TACAVAASANRPDRPDESRVGSTIPICTLLSLVTFLKRSVQVSFACGQPNVAATGSGIARTIGLRATEGTWSGTEPGFAARRRCSHNDESGTHTSGAFALPPACPTPI